MAFEYKNPRGIKVSLVDTVSPSGGRYHTISNVPLVLKVDDSGYIRNIGVIGETGSLIPIFGGRFYGGFAPEFGPNWLPAKEAFLAAKRAKADVLSEITQLEEKLEQLRQKAERLGFER